MMLPWGEQNPLRHTRERTIPLQPDTLKEQAAKEARALRETTREASRALQEASVDGSSRPTTPSAKPGAVVEGVTSDEIDSMRRQLDTLTNIVKEQFKMKVLRHF